MLAATYHEKATGRSMTLQEASSTNNYLKLRPSGPNWKGTSQEFAEQFEFIAPYKQRTAAERKEDAEPLPETPPELQICANCRFWGLYGVCAWVEFEEIRPRSVVTPEGGAVVCVTVSDSHNLDADLVTNPTFGCNQFQPKA